MHEDSQNGEKGAKLMKMEEDFVKGVADAGRGLEEDHHHGNRCDGSPLYKRATVETLIDSCEPFGGVHVDTPCTSMCHGLQYHDPANPSVKEVVCVKADPEKRNEGVVPACKNDERDHVHHREMPGPSSNFCYKGSFVVFLKIEKAAIDDVAEEVEEEKNCMQPRGKRSDVDRL